MATMNQLAKRIFLKWRRFRLNKALVGCPHKKATCVKVYTCKPRKPNSATRKIAKARLTTGKLKLIYLPGFGHSLQQFSTLFVRGGRCRDLPGVHYQAIRNKADFVMSEKIVRGSRRSKYGLPKLRVKFITKI